MVVRISDKTQNYSKVTKLLVKPNLIYIRDILGHSSVKTTEIYSKANPEVKRKHLLEAASKLKIEDNYSNEEKDELLDWLKTKL